MRLSIFAALATALFCFCPTACANAVYYTVRTADVTDQILANEETLWKTVGRDYLFSSYEEYVACGIGLGYDEAFFIGNDLVLSVRQTCSSENLRCTGVKKEGNAIYFLMKRNVREIHTEDIILLAWYAEVPESDGIVYGGTVDR